MEFIKEAVPVVGSKGLLRCVVRTDSYGRSLDFILALYHEIQTDFPYITLDKVELVIYGGRRIKGIIGLEFQADEAWGVPPSYQRVPSLEVSV